MTKCQLIWVGTGFAFSVEKIKINENILCVKKRKKLTNLRLVI